MADSTSLEQIIERAFAQREQISPATKGELREAVEAALALLDSGKARVATRGADGRWQVHQWLKKAVLLSFRLSPNMLLAGPEGAGSWWDKVPLKCAGWGAAEFAAAGFRAVPGAVIRRSAYIAPNVVLMPSFVNLGAYIGEGTMVDTWATVGSCAQIGKNVHLSGGVGIGGVLEPLQAGPTIIEDNCFIGARSEVVEGCIIREGAVLGMGVFIGKSTRIIDRETGEVFYGEVPPYSVVVAGSAPSERAAAQGAEGRARGGAAETMQAAEAQGAQGGAAESGKAASPKEVADAAGTQSSAAESGKAASGERLMGNGKAAPNLYCAVIVKRVNAQTRAKTAINELLRG